MQTTKAKEYNFRPEKRENVRKLFAGILRLLRIKRGKKTCVDYYFNKPLDEKSILVSGLGRSVRGNMQYLLNELNSSDEYEGYTIYVRTSKENTDEDVRNYIKQNNWTRTSALSSGLAMKMETCKYMITESYFPYSWVKKPGQVMIDLWHGTPLKRLGVLKEGDKCHKTAIQHKNFLCADYLLYPNEFTRDTMWKSYGITPLLSAKALMMGYPRTSGILKVSDEEIAELKEVLAPAGEHIYAYMPTFRGHLSDEEAVAREADLLGYIDGKLRDDQILYVNLHHHIKAGIDVSEYKHIKLFPPLLDSYKLLAVAEALISDYSSVFFDYLVTRKQIILYIEDLDSYLSHHGLNIDIEELPFDLARNREQLIDMLNKGKQYDDTEYFNAMCAFDSSDNPEKLDRLFLGDESGLKLEEIPDDRKRKVLLYTQGCAAGPDTDILGEIVSLNNAGETNLYISCDEMITSENMDGAYPLLHNTLVIGTRECVELSSVGFAVKQLYLKGKLSFGLAMKLLHFEYALVPKRMYGDVCFDTLGIYDTVNPEVIIGLALSNAKERILFISENMVAELRTGNRFLTDAIAFASAYCERIITKDKYVDEISNVLNRTDRERVIAADDASAIIELLK